MSMSCAMRCVIHVLFAELTMSSRVAAKFSMFGVLHLQHHSLVQGGGLSGVWGPKSSAAICIC